MEPTRAATRRKYELLGTCSFCREHSLVNTQQEVGIAISQWCPILNKVRQDMGLPLASLPHHQALLVRRPPLPQLPVAQTIL